MKAYVIKNKEGKYFTLSFKSNFTDDIRESAIFQEWEGADHDLDRNEFEDCEVVEITIAEGDLEKQLAEKDREINNLKELRKLEVEDKKELRENRLQEIIKLEKELAEKDKEIERLNGCMMSEQQVRNVIENDMQTLKYQLNVLIRHQVCEEIRGKFDKLCEVQDNLDYICTYGFEEILDQIEQGESK